MGDIKTLLDSGESGVSHLRRQRASLIAHRHQTDKMIAAIDTLLEDAMKDNALSVEEVGAILGDADFAAHQEEAEQLYGERDDWQESQRRTASWSAKDWQGNADRFQQVEKDMIAAICQGVLPDSDEAAALVASHRELLSEFFPVTPAKHYVISRSYIHDERFRSHYDSQFDGFAQWLVSAIECAARDSGVDTDNPEWK
ncbi:MAG: TipAS antibiotic-recognition domain-containing protein [Trueperella pyogenes]|nr:TipAS antibiotic-recognition domain-containing protein [Trueperella pyogenes]